MSASESMPRDFSFMSPLVKEPEVDMSVKESKESRLRRMSLVTKTGRVPRPELETMPPMFHLDLNRGANVSLGSAVKKKKWC